MSGSVDSNAPELFKLVQNASFVKAVQRVSQEPNEAAYVSPSSKLTCLHLAVKACKKSSAISGSIAAIRALLEAYPEAALLQDDEFGYTPLASACMSPLRNIEDDSAIVKLIIEFSPMSLQVLSKDGYTPLELHIMTMSRFKRRGDAMGIHTSMKGNKKSQDPTTAILKALLTHEHSTSSIAKALDALFECNSLAVLEQVALEESIASSLRLRARRQARASDSSVQAISGSTNFANFWVWEWALLLLQAHHSRRCADVVEKDTSRPQFLPMHAAAQVKDCPVPFLILAMRAYPDQMRMADERTGNLPLHFVAAWDVSDQSTVSRKSMALNAMVTEYPQAGSVRNKRGKTPMSLSLESGTSWDNGVRRLTSFRNEGSVRAMAAGKSMRSLR